MACTEGSSSPSAHTAVGTRDEPLHQPEMPLGPPDHAGADRQVVRRAGLHLADQLVQREARLAVRAADQQVAHAEEARKVAAADPAGLEARDHPPRAWLTRIVHLDRLELPRRDQPVPPHRRDPSRRRTCSRARSGRPRRARGSRARPRTPRRPCDRLPVELDDVAESVGVVAPAEAEPLGADPVLVHARRASLDLLVPPGLEDRRQPDPGLRRERRGSPAAAGGCASRPPSRARRSSAGAGRHRARSRAPCTSPPRSLVIGCLR